MYDMNTWLALKEVVNMQKKDVCEALKMSMSRANPLFATLDDWNECWTFYAWLNHNVVDLEARNCQKCGNYKQSGKYLLIPFNTLCICSTDFHLSRDGVLTLKLN